MDVKTIILGFLYYGEMSGYDIKQAFSNNIGYFYDASYGAIYPALRKMEQDGYVTKREIVQSGKPNKILYSITEEGKRLFHTEINTPIQPAMLRSNMLVKLFFGGLRSAEERNNLIEDGVLYQQKVYEQSKKKFKEIENELDEYQTLCWEYTLDLLKYNIQFLEKNRDRIKTGGQKVSQ